MGVNSSEKTENNYGMRAREVHGVVIMMRSKSITSYTKFYQATDGITLV